MGANIQYWTSYGTEYLGINPNSVPKGDKGREFDLTQDLPQQFLNFLDGSRITINHDVTPFYAWNVDLRNNFSSDDFLLTGWGRDSIYAGRGRDLVSTEAGNDFIDGGKGDDVLFAGTGDDVVYGGNGNDYISGDGIVQVHYNIQYFSAWVNGSTIPGSTSAGGQVVEMTGRYRTNELTDRGGNDKLFGGAGDDIILGGMGSDVIDGGTGNDFIDPGARGGRDNEDFVYGGSGADVFYLSGSAGGAVDQQVIDFFSGLASDAPKSFLKSLINTGLKEGLKDMSSDMLKAAFNTVLTGVGASVLSEVVGLVIDAIEDSLPSSEDVIRVLDFDPREDVMVLPAGKIDAQNLRFEVQDGIYRETQNGTDSQPESALVLYTLQDGVQKEYAVIHLDDGFQRAIGIADNPQGLDARAALQSVIDSAVTMGRDGVPSMIGEAQTVDGAQIMVLGAVAQKLHFSEDATSQELVIGTHFDDYISANDGYVEPGTEDDSALVNTTGASLYGFDGNDWLVGSTGQDMIDAGNGNDTIYTFGTSGARETIKAGAGTDMIHASANFDKFTLDAGFGTYDRERGEWVDNDYLFFTHNETGVEFRGEGLSLDGNDVGGVYGQYQTTNLSGLVGSGFDDTIKLDHFDFGGGVTWSLDYVEGGGGDDWIGGSDLGEKLNGGGDDDVLNGNGGDDYLFGGTGADWLVGGEGNDILNGFAGDDRLLNVGGGADKFYGGAGADRFIFRAETASTDIMDFEAGTDQIDLRDFDFTSEVEALSSVYHADESGVYFSHGETELIVRNTTLSDFADSLIL